MATGVLGVLVNVPGRGVIFANTGRETRQITFDSQTGDILDFQILSDAGIDAPFDDSDLEIICEVLGA